MSTWPLQQAKARLSELVQECAIEPQLISLRGKERVIVMSIEDYEKIIRQKGDLVTFMQNSPLMGLEELDFERDKSLSREVKF